MAKRVRAKKYLGQHFLKDETVCQLIAGSLTGHNDYKKVIEIGPGTGAITKYLVEENHDLSVVEVDGESILYLREHYPDLNIIDFNFLKMDLETYASGEQIGLVGNFPYFISSQILFKIYENKHIVSESIGMFQKEVAMRVAEKPGSKTYGILSVLMQAFYDVEYLKTVEGSAFIPPPKVQSGIIRLKRNKVEKLDCDEKLFKIVVKMGFNQRRKTLRNSLKAVLPDEIRANEILNKRPEQLGVDSFVEICLMIEEYSE